MRFPSFFFFNDTATTEIYTLSLHDALPISLMFTLDPEWKLRGQWNKYVLRQAMRGRIPELVRMRVDKMGDRKSTRLNSSHGYISYAVFCLKKKKKQHEILHTTTRQPSILRQ